MNLKLTRETIWLALISFTLCTFAFSERLNSWGIIFLGAFFLLDKNFILKMKKVGFNKKLLPLVGFFLLYLLFYFFSDMKTEAGHALFSKFTLFLLPLIFFYENYFTNKNERIIILIFSIALSCGFLYELIASLNANYFSAENPRLIVALGRMEVSKAIMHPGYYSVYFMFGVIWHYFNKSKFSMLFIALFTVALILLLSRITLGFYGIFIAFMALDYIRKSANPFVTALAISFLGAIACAGIYQLPTIKSRVNETFTKLNSTSKEVDISSATGSRKIAYVEEVNLILKKPIVGYGLGKSKQVLEARLTQTGYAELGKDMNNHSQYFKTWMELGITGFLALVALLLFLFRYYHKQKLKVAFWFTIMVTLGLLTDDLLEIQAGIVFFAIIWSLYLTQKEALNFQ